jgi:hypothetical protein
MTENTELELRPVIELIKLENTTIAGQLEDLRSYEIECQSDIDAFGRALVETKTRIANLEELERSITRPIRASLEAARAVFAPVKANYAALEGVLKAKIADATVRFREREAEAQVRAQVFAEEGDTVAAHAALVASPAPVTPSGITTREDWTFRVVDPSLVPRDFLAVNDSAIRAAMRAAVKGGGTPPVIAGVAFERVTRVIARRQTHVC